MAGFNFKKLTKDKNKNKGSSATHGSPQNGSKFMHFNLNGGKHDNSNKNDNNKSDNSLDSGMDKNRSVSNTNQSLASMNQNTEYVQNRVYPTPSNNQRNVSGATQLMQLQQQQRQTSNSSSLRTNNTQQQQQQHTSMVQSTPQHTQNQYYNSNNNTNNTYTNRSNVQNSPQQQYQQQFSQQQNYQNSYPSQQQNSLQTPQVQQYVPSPRPNQLDQFTPISKNVSPNELNNNTANIDNDTNNNISAKFQNKIIWNRIKLKNSPFPRYRHVASSYSTNDGRIFVIGGLHDQSVYGDIWIIKSIDNGNKFNSNTIDITDLTPPPRVGHASTLCGNAFIIFGGDTHKVNKDGLMDDDLYLFNINSYKWTIPNPVGPRPLGRYGHKISIIAKTPLNTKLYLFGGQFDDTYFNNISMFDLSSFRNPESHWEFLKPKSFIPPPLTNHTMVSFDNKLWVFGGDTLQGLLNKLFMYDPDINDWSLIDTSPANNDPQNVPPPMQEHAAIMYGNLMCIVGGKDELDDYLNTVYFLNMATFKWFKFPTISAGLPQGRSGHSLSLLENNKLLIMGGDKFDYAKPEEFDLHTSDVDMNSGTLLYTLDLTDLNELCPGINDNSSLPDRLKNDLNNVEKIAPSTPPTGMNSVRNISPTNNLRNDNNTNNLNNSNDHGFQIDINKLPEIAAHNILTPYTNAEAQKTPLIEGNESFNKSDQIMPIPIPIEAGLDDALKDKDNHPALNVNNAINANDNDNNNKILPSELIETPPLLESTQNNNTDENNTSQDGNNFNETLDHSKDHTLESNRNKSINSNTDSVNKHSVQQNNFKNSTNDFQRNPDALRSPETVVSKLQNDTTIVNNTHNINDEIKRETNGINATKDLQSNKIIIDKNVLQDLKNELIQIKSMTNAKVIEASKTMNSLEFENQQLKEQLLAQGNDKADDPDEVDKQMTNAEISELHSIIDDNIIDIKTLNNIIKRQNIVIEKVTLDDMFKDKYDELQLKYNVLLEENKKLKSKVNEEDREFTESVKSYSNQIDQLLTKWSTNTELKKNGTKNPTSGKSMGSDSDSDTDLENGNNSNTDHKTVVGKLSKQLDDLLIKSQSLSESRERLDAEYHKLEKRHRTLSQDLLSQQDGDNEFDPDDNTENDKHKKDNKSNNNLVIDTVRKLELAQLELENFRDKNKLLQVEIEQLKSSQNK